MKEIRFKIWNGIAILNRMLRKTFTDKGIVEQRPGRHKRVNHAVIWRKGIPAREKSFPN